MNRCQLDSSQPEETEQIGETIGKQLKGGEIIKLISDLGGGKTTFTKGLARGAGSSDHVSSPTFTVHKQYTGREHTVYHYDFYRLGEPGLIKHELADVLGDENSIIVIEWPGSVEDSLPPERTLHVRIESGGETKRSIVVEAPDSLEYVVDKLC